MPTPKSRRQYRPDDAHPGGSFPVTCVIGHVTLDPNGDTPPHVAAFTLIANHDAPGEFTFPMVDGRTCVVVVSHEADRDG